MGWNNINLSNGSILKLLAQYSTPSVFAMIVGAVCIIVDRIYIGKYIGEDVLASTTIAFPLMLAVMVIAAMIAAGMASVTAI